MKYLFLDTNIYLDMVVYRNKENPPRSYDYLLKLLEFDQVKLIIPKIVIAEVKRHLEDEIDKVGENLKGVKNGVENMYWISNTEDIQNFDAKVKMLSKTVNQVLDEFAKNNLNYKNEFKDKLEKILNNKNNIILDETQELIFNVNKRMIYKLCPFHIKGKESIADALILETLINIKKFIELRDEDKIFFITKNYKDFSKSKESKTEIHPHIFESLISNGLDKQVIYSLRFYKTIIDNFKEELESADEFESILLDAFAEEEAERKAWEDDIENMDRNSVGLSNLPSDDSIIEWVNESIPIENLKQAINEYEHVIARIDEYIDNYYNLEDNLQNTCIEDLLTLVDSFNKKSGFLTINLDNNDDEYKVVNKILEFINTYIADIETLQQIYDNYEIKDYFNLETLVDIRDFHNNRIQLNAEGYFNPESFGQDTIELKILRNSVVQIEGYIEISYGGIEFDEDGGVGNGCEESIEFHIDNVIDYIKSIVSSSLDRIKEVECMLDKFIDFIGFEGIIDERY